MNKKLYLLLGMLVSTLTAQAQQVVDFDDLLTTHKKYIYGLDTNLVQLTDLEKKGDHQKWDFTLLSFLKPDTVTILPTSSEENPNEIFYSVHSSLNGSTAYLKKNKSSLSTQAYDFKGKNNTSMNLRFSVPEKVLEFPLLPGKNYRDSSVAEMKIKSPYANFDSLRVFMFILRNSSVEASGSLLLPSGTNHKVLKIKVTEQQVQYSFFKKGEQWISSDTLFDRSVNYLWVAKNAGYMVMRNETDPTSNKIATYYLNSTFVSGTEQSGPTSIGIYPNPAREFISVSLKGYEEGTVLLECLDANALTVFQRSHAVKGDQTVVQLELPSLEPGTYHLRVSDAKNTSLAKFVVIR